MGGPESGESAVSSGRYTSETGRKAAKRSRVARRKLNLARVEAELPVLTDVASAMHRLDVIGRWALAGMVHGAVASAACRSVEIWLKGHESKLQEQIVEEIKADIDRLKLELKGSPQLSVTR